MNAKQVLNKLKNRYSVTSSSGQLPDGHPAIDELYASEGSGCPFKPASSTVVNSMSADDFKISNLDHNKLKIASAAPSVSTVSPSEGGCPFKPSGSAATVNHSSVDELKDAKLIGEKRQDLANFKTSMETTKETFYASLISECENIEKGFKDAEAEVLRKEDEAFLMQRNELELSRLKANQATELLQIKATFQKMLETRSERKKTKMDQRILMRKTKRRDLIIEEQENASRATVRVKETLSFKRQTFDATMAHIENAHEKQRKQLSAAQDRKLSYEKTLHDMEVRHLNEVLRSTENKKFQVRITHQLSLDKHIAEQLHAIQQLEIKHLKDRFDLDIMCFEELEDLRVKGVTRVSELKLQQATELYSEKDRLAGIKETQKLEKFKRDHGRELKQIVQGHRLTVRGMKMAHDGKVVSKRSKAKKTAGSETPGCGGRLASTGASVMHSRRGSSDSITSDLDDNASVTSSAVPQSNGNINVAANVARDINRFGLTENLNEEEENELDGLDGIRKETSLEILVRNHRLALEALEQQIRDEITKLEMANQSKLKELEEEQETEKARILEIQQDDYENKKAVQEKEIQMEASVHDAEMKMLLERRILNSVLETVVDGIINIDTIGTIMRFNVSAERMFGYTADEIVGKNIKSLMPPEYAIKHDGYLNRYMTTGVKRVVGSSRRVSGLKKDGTVFPIHLSVSEVKEEGTHWFTGIIRDLTEEVRNEQEAQRKDEEVQKELEDLITQLDESKARSDGLLKQMLPLEISDKLMKGQKVEPQSFEEATVFFSDIVGFTNIASSGTPFAVVDLLGALYQMFDEIISTYDAYKVETIGDAYMVVSGVPRENGKRHASEVATMALHIASKISTFQVPGRPDVKLQIRIGINSGPVVAGVVGTKMPRYCLFGDTVNTASRMESTGQANKIQISAETYTRLKAAGGFHMTERGEVEVKGKGKMKTYFLTGREDCPFKIPE